MAVSDFDQADRPNPHGTGLSARGALHTQRAVLGGNSSRTPDRAGQTGGPPAHKVRRSMWSNCRHESFSPESHRACVREGLLNGDRLLPLGRISFHRPRTMEWTRTTVWTQIRQLPARLKDTARYYGAQRRRVDLHEYIDSLGVGNALSCRCTVSPSADHVVGDDQRWFVAAVIGSWRALPGIRRRSMTEASRAGWRGRATT